MDATSLPDLDSASFELYLAWLPAQSVPRRAPVETASERCCRLVKWHVLGETVKDKKSQVNLREEIVDTVLEDGRALVAQAIVVARSTTQVGCVTRRFLVHLHVLIGSAAIFDDKAVPRTFILDRAQCLTERGTSNGSNIRALLQKIWYVRALRKASGKVAQSSCMVEFPTKLELFGKVLSVFGLVFHGIHK
jgi:hypothetical protein